MREVAERAGVSKATVSYVLNGRDSAMRISDDTRRRILEAMRDLNYHPNSLARSLSSQSTRTIAIVMQYPRLFAGWSGFTNELMHGVTDAAVTQGYDVMLHTRSLEAAPGAEGAVRSANTSSANIADTPVIHADTADADALKASIEIEAASLTDGRVDGALLLRDMDDPLAARLEACGLPIVMMFSRPAGHGLWYVDCDNVRGGRMATEHLLALGHRRIAHLAGPARSGSGRERRQGYESALRDAGIALRPAWIVEAPGPFADLRPLACLFRDPGGRPRADAPTAIFAWSDDVAMQTLRLLRQEGLRVPHDVALVGFDSTRLCEHTDPPLTSVRQPVYEMAFLAMERLAQRLRGETPTETQTRFAPALMVRSSCGTSSGKTSGRTSSEGTPVLSP